MLPSHIPAYSIGPGIGLVVNGLLAVLCLFLAMLNRGFRPLFYLLLLFLCMTTFFLGYTIYGFQISQDSIMFWYRLMMAGLCMIPAAWVYFAAALNQSPAGLWCRIILAWSVTAALIFMLTDQPWALSLPLEYLVHADVWRPRSLVLRPMAYGVCLLVNMVYVFAVWFRWWPVPGKPHYAWAVWLGLVLWFMGALHDSLYGLGYATPFKQTVFWFTSIWMSICLALAVSFQMRDLERRLETSRAKFSTAFAASPVALTISDLEEGRFVEVNDTFLKLSGYERPEVIGRTSVGLGFWTSPQARQRATNALRPGQSFHREMRLTGKHGLTLLLDVWARSVELDGRMCLISVCNDITQRKVAGAELQRHRHHLEELVSERTGDLTAANQDLQQEIAQRRSTEDALRESRRNLQVMFDSLQDMVFVVDANGILLSTNPEVSRCLGYGAGELRGSSIFDLHPPQARADAAGLLKELSAGGPDTSTLPLITIGGDLVPVETKWAWGQWDQMPALIGITRDVSERRRAEETLSQLAAGVAHNFNNLLAAIMGNAQAAQARLANLDTGDAELSGLMGNVVLSAAAGREVVQRLAAYVGRRQPPLGAQVVELGDAVRAALEITRAAYHHQGSGRVEFAVDLQPGLFVSAQRSEIMDVCLNLIKNAVEAMPVEGLLAVSAQAEGDLAVLSFEDTGAGMDQATQNRLFEPFFSTKGTQGRGLGLASTRGVLRSLGGDISIRSRLGQGTSIRLELPLCDKGPLPLGPTVAAAVEPGLLLVLVEDEALVAMGIKALLSEAGYRVKTASGVQDARELLAGLEPDLVLCDLGLPDGSGWDVAAFLASQADQNSSQRPPFILLTGWGAEVAGDAPPQGAPPAVAVLYKPLERQILLITVAQAIALKPADTPPRA